MGELGDILLRMLEARDRLRTVRLVLCESAERELLRRAEARVYGEDDPIEDEEPDDRRPSRSVIWFESGVGYREEPEGRPQEADVATEGSDPHTIRPGQEFLDSRQLIEALRFEHMGHTTIAGRDAHLLRAWPAGRAMGPFALLAVGEGADSYELAIDAERGLLLRSIAFLDDREFSRREVVEIAFDETFPPGLFTAPDDPEDGFDWRAATGQPVSLQEAAARASFRVFAPAELGPGWVSEMVYEPADDDVPETVTLIAVHAGGIHRLSVVQQATGSALDELEALHTTWRSDTHGGEGIRLGERSAEPGFRAVEAERDGTRLSIRSHSLPKERLLELLDRLEPV